MAAESYKYFAFISYNSKDIVWGKRLQKKLEGYRIPSTLCSEHNWDRKPIKPVFFAPTDIQPGELTAELQERLKASRNLIVICSPDSAKSKWVGKEIEYFSSLGRTDHIHFFIVSGEPHSGNEDTECFNPVVAELGLPEILGANIHEKVSSIPWVNKERAYIQLITKLLEVEFDSIWKRHKRLMLQRVIAWCAGIIAMVGALFFVWKTNHPEDVRISLNEVSIHNDQLPSLKNAVVTLDLGNEIKIDTIANLTDIALFSNIPHRFIGHASHITVKCENWVNIDTTIVLANHVCIGIERDPHPYGDIQFLLWDPAKERAVPDVMVTISGLTTITDGDGRAHFNIPLEKQAEKYVVNCALPLIDNVLEGIPTSASTALIIK